MIAYTLETTGLLTNENNPTNSWSSDRIMLKAMQLSAYFSGAQSRPVIHADAVGCELIDRLKIDCSLIEVEFPEYPRDMFGFSKLFGFSRLKAPFTHLDFDLFIRDWNALPSGWTVYCVESLFSGSPYEIVSKCYELGVKRPAVWRKAPNFVYNLGLYTCLDSSVNEEHTETVFQFYEDNSKVLAELPYETRTAINMAVDQLTLTSIMCQRNIVPHATRLHTRVSKDYNVVHLMGETKAYLENEVWINSLHQVGNLPNVEDALDYWTNQKLSLRSGM